MADSELHSLKAALNCWEWFGYVSTGIVCVGCIGEFVAEFTSYPTRKEAKHGLARLSLIILIFGIAGELLGAVRTSQLSGQIIANIEADAADAERKAGEANDRASANAKETEVLRKSNLELQAKLSPRRLSSGEKQLLRMRAANFRTKSIAIGSVNGGTEGADYALDFKDTFSDPRLHFDVQFSTPTTIVFGGLRLIGSLQIENGKNRKHDSEILVAALLEIGITRDLITVRGNDNPDLLALTVLPKPMLQ